MSIDLKPIIFFFVCLKSLFSMYLSREVSDPTIPKVIEDTRLRQASEASEHKWIL